MYRIALVILIILTSSLVKADDLVIEILISSDDNKTWDPKESMHLTIGHLKNVEAVDIQKAVSTFNKNQKALLEKNLLQGFIVKNFNDNGFGVGYHILEADKNTFDRISEINYLLYQFLNKEYGINFTLKTTPRDIYDELNQNPNTVGYTPHIEFNESTQDKIPVKNTLLKFACPKLTVRIINFSRKELKAVPKHK